MNYHAKFIQMRANLIREGWYQGAMFKYDSSKGPACLAGHMQRVAGSVFYSRDLVVAFGRVTGITDIPSWNDYSYRTFQEVIAAVDRCIAATAPPPEPEPVVSITAHDANLIA